VRYTDDELRAMIARGESRTDWARVDAMPQAEVERLAEEEDGPLPEGWEDAAAHERDPRPVLVAGDIIAWFQATGPGWAQRLNDVLRAHVAAHPAAGEGGGT
jgi:uncharacterized protein (DUF4415 family)